MSEAGAANVREGTLLWQPSEKQKANTNLAHYLRWIEDTRGLAFTSYQELWAWSVTDLEAFWTSIWDFFSIRASRPYARAIGDTSMPGTVWFQGAELSYAEHALMRRDDHLAVISKIEGRPTITLSYAELADRCGAVAHSLRAMGVGRGDRVVAYMPNTPETLVAFLATASIGAIWSCCAPEFGVSSVVDRFRQIEPRVLISVDGYHYNGRTYDRLGALGDLLRELPTLETTVLVPGLSERPLPPPGANVVLWEDLLRQPAAPQFEQVPFDHPLWVLYSSGTTGLPKPIVHSHGGILLEQYKSLSLQLDLSEDDRFFWFTTTGWMMWNKLISSLLLGTTVLLYDGSPAHPDMNALWRFAEETGMTYFGASAPYLLGCRKAGIHPGRDFDLHRLRGLGSTGAPLPPEGFQWVYEEVGSDLLLGSVSGGTDVCTAFVGSCPLLPVRAGELQCRSLGAAVEAYDAEGRSLVNEVGELVLTRPLPSMPVYLWNDPDGRRYRESYFDVYPGVWRHGDWIKVTPEGGCVIYGRSDSTLNRGGVRMGTSELYRVVEELPEIADSLVVDTSELGVEGQLLLFIVLCEGSALDDALRQRINQALSRQLSPRHVPNRVYAVEQVPRTLNGKKVEVPVKRILAGAETATVISPDAMSNPESLRFFEELAANPPR